MFDFFIRLLGIRAVQEGHISDWRIDFSRAETPFQKLVFLMGAALAAYVVWWFYKREPDYCALRKRRLLAGLRYAGLLILLFILSGPVLRVFLRGYIKGKIVVLVDSSKSMSRVDKYTRPEDKLVAAHVLGNVALKETDPRKVDTGAEVSIAKSSRMDLVRALLHNKDIEFLKRLQSKHDVEMWTFSKAADMRAVEPGGRKLEATVLDHLQPEGLATEIGGSIRSVLNRLKGQALSAVILLTDGGNNKGEEPALVAQDSPARIYPIGIGVPEARDVALSYLFMESKIFLDDLAPIYVRLKQHGFNKEPAELIVTNATNNEEIGRQAIALLDTGEQNETLHVKPKKAGKFTYKVEVRLLNLASEDSEPSNNFKSREIEVIDQKLNVLLLEAEPRWEYRYLKNSLVRDKRVNCKVLLRVPDMAELAKGGSPEADKPGFAYLKEFPSREELFKYHVIVFGNMPNDGFFTEHDIDNLRRFVIEEGGGIWFIAGKNNLPDAYKESKLELLLPIEFETNPQVSAEDEQLNPITDPFRLALTPEGRAHSVTRLDMGSGEGGDEQNAALWELVPEMYWYHKATRPKLNASVLMVCNSEKGGTLQQRGGPAPLLLTAQVGRGRVLYQAFADLWRMRYPSELGPDALERMHGHIIQYLGLTKLLGRTARVEIATDKEEYGLGDRVKISARVLTKKEMDYSSADHVTAVVADMENDANQVLVDLTPEPGQRGAFRGEITALQGEGHFRVRLKEEEEEQAHADFSVVIPQVEMETPDMKKELLDNVAKSSMKAAAAGEAKVGMYFADQAGQMLKDLSQAQREIEEKKENTLWDAPILLVLFTLFMGAEWLIRKRNDLL